MTTRTNKMLPKDLNAEAAVLSAMIVDNDSIPEVIDEINEDFFYHNHHQLIFAAIKRLFVKNIEVDIITLIDELRKGKVKRSHRNELDVVGGEVFINELADMVLSGANIKHYVNIVKSKALLRNLIKSSVRILEVAYQDQMEGTEALGLAEEYILEISGAQTEETMVSGSESVLCVMDNVSSSLDGKQQFRGIKSGFYDLDRIIGGFGNGHLIILAARPSLGKTSLVLAFALNASLNFSKKVGIFTMEMEHEELSSRMLSMRAEVPLECFTKSIGWNENKVARTQLQAQKIHDADLQIDTDGVNTILSIRAKALKMKAKMGGLDMIIIDYLQLMSGMSKTRESRQQEISDISRNLKILAKELGIPIIALSQLNRGLEVREDKRPRLSDLRSSGAIEQDADLVCFLYRDEVYNPETVEVGVAELIIRKNRHGSIGTVFLDWQGEYTLFRSVGERSPLTY